MHDESSPSELVLRLHQLRVERGVTIQAMAELCGLPKSTLESYMKMKAARRPGLDALIAIANGMDVSIDWLVGRASSKALDEDAKRKLAVAAYDATVHLLQQLCKAQAESSKPVISEDRIAGRTIDHTAVLAMLDFVASSGLFAAPGGQAGRTDLRDVDAVLEVIEARQPATE
ncbi:helix-turn-helix domain-containing protein [Rhodovulum sp. DZ06]|uniref:helix-turn-helix domain-containing protein n=1 Tax=Rhodovulum sp. DZ06 TaxID=3425126 RepID=UPI003D338E0D